MRSSRPLLLVAIAALVVAGCPSAAVVDPKHVDSGSSDAATPKDASSGEPTDDGVDPDAPPGEADTLRALLATCTKQLSTGLFKTDDQPTAPANIPICDFGEAVFWHADFDIDCDGEISDACNIDKDPDFLPHTAATASNGKFLQADVHPYVVIPQPSAMFDYTAHDLELGSVVMVVHGQKITYAIIGDAGPAPIIGEGSYALAKRLGIDPDPAEGGNDGPVLFVAFKGKSGVVTKNEDHDEAVAIGKARRLAVFPGR